MLEYILIAVSFIILLILWLFSEKPLKLKLPRDYFENESRNFLVTGAASGVGKHLSLALLKKGHFVTCCDINLKGLKKNFKHYKNCHIMKLDITNEEDWQLALEESQGFNGYDVVFNIAGYLLPEKIQNCSLKGINNHLDINLKGIVLGTHYASEIMQLFPREYGTSIVNFSSLGAFSPVNGVGLYTATKAAVRGFSLSAAKDLEPLNIFVTVVCPDAINTPMVELQKHYKESSWAFSGDILDVEDIEKVIFEQVLIQRPREVVIATSFAREFGAKWFANFFSSSKIIKIIEDSMVKTGLKQQEKLLKNN